MACAHYDYTLFQPYAAFMAPCIPRILRATEVATPEAWPGARADPGTPTCCNRRYCAAPSWASLLQRASANAEQTYTKAVKFTHKEKKVSCSQATAAQHIMSQKHKCRLLISQLAS